MQRKGFSRTARIEWQTLSLIFSTYGLWVFIGWQVYPHFPVTALCLLALLNALHSSLVHEALHGHPTRKRHLNELLVTANPGLIWPYRRYRTLHLRHHADETLTDPFDDPESYYRAQGYYAALPLWVQRVLGWSNTLLGRLVLGPPLSCIALICGDISALRHGERDVAKAWLLHGLGLIPVLFCLFVLFEIPLWLYLGTACWGGAALISLRTFAEHQWHETPEGRTIIVEKSPFSFLFLNNNLHLVHHKNPAAPWYTLPALYAQDKDHWRRMNQHYVFPNYWKLIRTYALIAKEPVVHPAWHRSKEAQSDPIPRSPTNV
ncbi:fatty acid desaturase [Neptunicoccus sediminis]|uniref:fatty acid desaturase n=1 Tax=Neptunicoccus sediminis TaxID=1892596 RepID=UPI000845EDB2|nr:fatty acid desaturase [Neptunicoccus sediminis]